MARYISGSWECFLARDRVTAGFLHRALELFIVFFLLCFVFTECLRVSSSLGSVIRFTVCIPAARPLLPLLRKPVCAPARPW